MLCCEAAGVVRLACVPEGLTAAAGCRPTLPGPLRAAPRRPLQVPGTAQAVSFSEDHVTVRRAVKKETLFRADSVIVPHDGRRAAR